MIAEDRVEVRISRAELERRWGLVRARLSDEGIDALVCINNEDFLGGYVRWLSDVPALNAYHRAVVFHARDGMTIVEHGRIGEVRRVGGDDPSLPGVSEVRTTAAFHSAAFSNTMEADIVVDDVLHRSYLRIALAGTGAMPNAFVRRLHSALDGRCEIVDRTDFLDGVMAIKSEEEQRHIAEAAGMQDIVFARVLPRLEPGMRDRDVQAMVQYEGRLLGSEQGVFMMGSSPPGEPAVLRGMHHQGRVIREGDALTVLIENNGPSGFYVELGRTIVFGRAPPSLLDSFALALEAQAHALSLMVPGDRCADIHARYNGWMRDRGLPEDARVFAHGQGYSLVERPLIRGDETMTLQAGMSLAVHPSFVRGGDFGYVCDNYLIGPSGPGACLHRTEKKVFEL